MAGKERSPNYPSIGLGDAVDVVRALYVKEGRGMVPSEVAFKSMGYKSASGTAKSHLGAVRAYGLVEGTKGNVKISERGLVLMVMPATTPEYAAALRDAAIEPPIFRELFESKPEASDETLRHHLILTKKFLEDAADRLIRVYRATLMLAGLDKASYNEPKPAVLESSPVHGTSSAHMTLTAPPAEREVHRWRLSPKAVADLVIEGELDLSALKRLKRYVSLLEESLTADDPKPTDEPPE